MRHAIHTACIGTALALSAVPGHAASILADTVIEFYNSGTGAGPEGGAPTGGGGGFNENDQVPFSHVTDGDSSTFISLPDGSFITLGFSTGFIFDAPGQADLFIDEIGNGGEDAEVFVSGDFGQTFTYLTTAQGNRTNEIDFADFGYTGEVDAVKLIGLDNGGSAPGFDLTFIGGLEGSVEEEPRGPDGVVPLPAALPLLAAALGGLGLIRRRA